MADYYKLAGSNNSTVDWTTEVILEKDDEGNVTKAVGASSPAQLNKSDLDKLEELGYTVEESSKEEAEKAEVESAVGADVAAAAPILGTANVDQVDQSGESKSNAKKS